MTDVPSRARLLALQIAALLVAQLAVVVLLALWFYERNEQAAANRDLRVAARSMTPADTLPGFWVVLDHGGRTTTPGLPAGFPRETDLERVRADHRPRQRELEAGGRTYFVRTVPRGGAVVQVVMDRNGAEEATGRVLLALALAGGVGVVLAAGIAALLAHRAFRPVEEALAMQRRFVADAGHELRTPVTLLSTRVQMLARRLERHPDLPEPVRADVRGVVADTSALGDILEELLMAADPGATGERTVCSLSALVAASVDAVQASAAVRGRILSLGRTDVADLEVSPGAVRRAVTALLDNALDHARHCVTVDVVAETRRAIVTVTDDGPGVDAAQRDRMFERFASDRPDEDTARRHYGLGLALVAEVAAAHRGTVAVRGRADGQTGAVFELTLPRTAQKAARTTSSVSP